MEILYGRHAVLEALRAGRRTVHRVLLAQGTRHGEIVSDIVEAARARGCPVAEVSHSVVERVGNVNHQGVIAETAGYRYVDADVLLGSLPEGGSSLFLVLDHLQDVQNLGTLLRTAEAMAVTGVLLPSRRAASITPAVVNASSGAVEYLAIAEVVNLVQTIGKLKQAGVWVVGLEGSPEAIPLGTADLSGSLALVVGAEGSGLSRLVRQQCDWLLSIPMYGKVDSLNAAVAGSLAIVAARQTSFEGEK